MANEFEKILFAEPLEGAEASEAIRLRRSAEVLAEAADVWRKTGQPIDMKSARYRIAFDELRRFLGPGADDEGVSRG